jgi:hypothetical protein
MNTFRVLICLTAATILLSDAKAQSTATSPPWFQGYYLKDPLTRMYLYTNMKSIPY